MLLYIFLILIETVLLLLLQFTPSHILSDFSARKACHSITGLIMLLLDPALALCRWYVYLVVVSSLSMTWLSNFPNWRFGVKYDRGITVYVTLVGAWFHLRAPIQVLLPMFLADPAGAVVGECKIFLHFIFLFSGKYVSGTFGAGVNPAWYGRKTVFGSLAVFIVTMLTLHSPPALDQRLVVSSLATLAEAVSEKYDNLLLAAVVVMAWLYT